MKQRVIKIDLSTLKGDKGEKGDKPIAGVDFVLPKDGKDGETPTTKELEKIIKPLIPKVKDGKDGRDGTDGKTPTKTELKELIQPLIPKVKNGTNGKDGSPDTPQEIAQKINTLKKEIDWKVLKNVPDMASKIGGGQDVAVYDEGSNLTNILKQLHFVGAGVTATQLSDGVIVVTIPGGGGSANLVTESVTAVQSGNNVTIDLTQLAHTYSAIQFVSRNGQIQTPTNWSVVGDVLTLQNASSGNAFLIQYTYA